MLCALCSRPGRGSGDGGQIADDLNGLGRRELTVFDDEGK
jgi:hypothetical protein